MENNTSPTRPTRRQRQAELCAAIIQLAAACACPTAHPWTLDEIAEMTEECEAASEAHAIADEIAEQETTR